MTPSDPPSGSPDDRQDKRHSRGGPGGSRDDGLPSLPSDEELGLDGLDEEALLREFGPGSDEEDEPLDPAFLPRAGGTPEPGTGRRGGGEASASTASSQPPVASATAPPPAPPPPRRKATAKEAPPPPPGKGPPGGRGASSGGGSGRWVVALLALVLLVGGVWISRGDAARPAPVPANAPDTAFSSARAMTHLVELARAPRPVGAPEHDRARELITGWLADLGLEPRLHESLSLRRGGNGEFVSAASLRSIVARIPADLPPGSPRHAVVLTAHYDAVPLSHGAGDAGVGVVAIVEAVRALRASLAAGASPLRNDLILLFTDGEEIGLLGARAFVDSHPYMDDVRLVISAEMRGTSGPVHMFETGPENGWIVRAMQEADPNPWATSLSVEIYRRLPNDTDFTPFREAGIQGLNFAAIGGARHYHQATDRAGQVEEATLQHMGVRLLALSGALGRAELTEVHAPDRVFLTLPGVGIVGYPRGLALPLSVAAVLLWILAAWLAVRRAHPVPRAGGKAPSPPRGGVALGVGALLALVTLGGGALAGWGLLQLLRRFHPEFGWFTSAVDGEHRYLLALGVATVTFLLLLVALARRALPLLPLVAGALWPLAAGALVAGVAIPLVSLEFQIVLGGASLALLLLTLTGGDPRWGGTPTLVGLGVAVLLVLPGAAVLVPLLEGLTDALSLRSATLVGAGTGLLALALLPGLLALLAPGGWGAPLLGTLTVAGLLASSIHGAGASSERPLPSTLLWAQEAPPQAEGVDAELLPSDGAGGGAPSPAGDPEEGFAPDPPGDPAPEAGESAEAQPPLADPGGAATPPPPGPRALWVTRDDPGFAWAEERKGTFGEPGALPEFLLPGSLWRTTPAPTVQLPAPRVRVEEVEPIGAAPALPGAPAESTPGPSLRVRVRVASGVGAERLSVILPEGAALRSIDGERPPDGPSGAPGARRDVTRLTHQGRPFHPEGLLLELELPAGTDALSLTVVEEHLRARELLGGRLPGTGTFVRPPDLIPSSGGRSDRALLRTPVHLPLEVPSPPEAPPAQESPES